MRAVHDGGLNRSAFTTKQYSYDEVSLLLEVYSQLEEPDGLSGGFRVAVINHSILDTP